MKLRWKKGTKVMRSLVMLTLNAHTINSGIKPLQQYSICSFIVSLVTWPLSISEAGSDLVFLDVLMLISPHLDVKDCREVWIKTRSPLTSLLFKDHKPAK